MVRRSKRYFYPPGHSQIQPSGTTHCLSCPLCACVVSGFSHVRLCDPMDCSPPGSSVHGFLRQEYWSGSLCPPPVLSPTQLLFSFAPATYYSPSYNFSTALWNASSIEKGLNFLFASLRKFDSPENAASPAGLWPWHLNAAIFFTVWSKSQ